MNHHYRSYEFEGELVVDNQVNRSSSVWLKQDGMRILSDAILSGPGSHLVGRKVRVIVTVLDEEIPFCKKCGRPTHGEPPAPELRFQDCTTEHCK